MTTAEHLINALQKLRWAQGGDWSVSLTPGEAASVLGRLEADEELFPNTGTVDHRPYDGEPMFFRGEDDEQA